MPDSVSPAGPRDDDLVGGELGVEIVGERLHDDAVGRGERAELDEVLGLDEAARRPERRHDQQRVAGVGIVEPVELGADRRTESVMLERAGPTMLRLMPSGRVGSTTSLPSVTVQPARRWPR